MNYLLMYFHNHPIKGTKKDIVNQDAFIFRTDASNSELFSVLNVNMLDMRKDYENYFYTGQGGIR